MSKILSLRRFEQPVALLAAAAFLNIAPAWAAVPEIDGDSFVGVVLQGKPLHFKPTLTVPIKRMAEPERRGASDYECDSAFAEGEPELLHYGRSSFEATGKSAVLRDLDFRDPTNRLLLSFVELDGRFTLDMAKTQLPKPTSTDNDGKATRMRYGFGGLLEQALDLSFENGRLVRAEYWIAC